MKDELRLVANCYAEHCEHCPYCRAPGAQVCAEGLKLMQHFFEAVNAEVQGSPPPKRSQVGGADL